MQSPLIPLHPQGRRGRFPFRRCAAIPSVGLRPPIILWSQVLFGSGQRQVLSGRVLPPAAWSGRGPLAKRSGRGSEATTQSPLIPLHPQGRRGRFPFRRYAAIPSVGLRPPIILWSQVLFGSGQRQVLSGRVLPPAAWSGRGPLAKRSGRGSEATTLRTAPAAGRG